MKTPHKHAEATIAWLQDQSGKLEFKRPLPCAGWEVTYGLMNPIANPDFEWRIKPEPKPDTVCYARSGTLPSTVRREFDDIKLIVDGETGKLKYLEILT